MKQSLAKRVFRAGTVWSATTLLIVASVSAAIWFGFSIAKGWRIQGNRGAMCPSGNVMQNSYVQLEVMEQDPIEPFFRGNILMIFAQKDVPEGTNTVSVSTVEGHGYYGNFDNTKIVLQKGFGAYANPDFIPTEFTRSSGSHRDFPFDSAVIDFGLRWNPQIPVNGVMFRNYNQSFYMPCEMLAVKTLKPGVLDVSFELRRNPLVQVAAIVLLTGAFIFVIAIGFFVKIESLPTAIASYFFSLWSIRSILSSEMKTFPTVLDVTILSSAVALVVIVGIRMAIHLRPKHFGE